MTELETPVRHILSGINYYEFLRRFHEKRAPNSYFEIGVNKGKSLHSVSCASVGVDPVFCLEVANIIGKKPFLFLSQLPSDDFFAKMDLSQFFPDGVDIAFLDGMHHFEFLLRDFYNAEKFSNAKSAFFLHDCLPINFEMAGRERNKATRRDKELQSHWAGDVWKMVPILQEYRPDLKITVLDCPPTGLVLIENMDPSNRVLVENYEEIVGRFADVPFGDEELSRLRQSLDIVSSNDFLASL